MGVKLQERIVVVEILRTKLRFGSKFGDQKFVIIKKMNSMS